MSAREDIATAASTVAGVDCTAHYRQSLKPGDAFVRLAVRNRDDSGFGFVDTWQVWIALPQDVVAAETWIEEHSSDLIVALDAQLLVTSITPAELVLGSNPVPGVIVEGTRAMED